MNKYIEEYFVYGLNNSRSLISSEKYIIHSIVIMKDSIAESDETISRYSQKNKSIVIYS